MCMAAVKGKDTAPEVLLRRALHAKGYRFRIHRAELPGKPDIVLPRFRTVLFVHGCFWHGHDCRRGARKPTSRTEYWEAKVRKNRGRDRQHVKELWEQGWNVVVVWECELYANRQRLDDYVWQEIIGRIVAPQQRTDI
jgi:DNA mismatch endonuclease (patch repair protein)